jgi:phospholipid-translocating ATPase
MSRVSLFGFFKNLVPFVSNKLVNTKYTWLNFIPIVLFNQFKYFFNFFFLMVALSQFIEKLRVGFFIAYVGPLAFVIVVTMLKEFYDDH